MKRITSILLAALLVLSLAACSSSDKPADASSPAGSSPFNLLPGVSESAAVAVPSPKGADSVKTLVEKSIEFFRSDCDYSKIADVHDPVALLAYYLVMEDLYDDRDMTLAEAREKAVLIYGTAEDLEKKDPEFAALLWDEMDMMEPEEVVNEYMSDLRYAMKEGDITPETPNYETYQQMIIDWDKGADYLLEHYPLITEEAKEHRIPIGKDGALEMIRELADYGSNYNRDLKRFAALQVEYDPLKTNVGKDGICSYDMGRIDEEGTPDVWMLDMLYYVENGTYYLIGYSVCVGSKGG